MRVSVMATASIDTRGEGLETEASLELSRVMGGGATGHSPKELDARVMAAFS